MISGPDGGANPAPRQTPSTTDSSVPDYTAMAAASAARLANGTGTMADQGVVMQGSAGNLVAAAGTGFRLTPEAAAAGIAAVREALDQLANIESPLRYVLQAPQLGDLRAARKVSAFTQSVAIDRQGFHQGIESLKATLNQMLDAYKKAVDNYQQIEQRVADSMTRLGQAVQRGTLPPPRHGRTRAV